MSLIIILSNEMETISVLLEKEYIQNGGNP